MHTLAPITMDVIRQAQLRLAPWVRHSPLVRLETPDSPAEIYLKLENLQPTGSFKLRGALNALAAAPAAQLEAGVWTASAGNMGQALAWGARARGVPCTVVMPQGAAPVKVERIKAFGAAVLTVPFSDYQEIQRTRQSPALAGLLIHPFADPEVIAGNGTIALEILADLPEVDLVICPYGGGGLSCGIASALRVLKPQTKVFAAEVETGAPFHASLAAGMPVNVNYQHSFINGIGAPYVFPEMWALAARLLDDALVVSVAQVAEAIRQMLSQNHILAEGAGAVATAAAVAAAQSGQIRGGKIVCIVSGGNLDPAQLCTILAGRLPQV